MTTATGGMRAPRVRGRLRRRPTGPIRSARGSLLAVIASVVTVAVILLIALVVLRVTAIVGILPLTLPAVVIAVASWLAGRGFKDRTRLSFVLAVGVALTLTLGGLGLLAYLVAGRSGIGGNPAFLLFIFAVYLLILGLPLLVNLILGRSWFLSAEAKAEVATASTLEAEVTAPSREILAGSIGQPAGSTDQPAASAHAPAPAAEPLVSVHGLAKHFPIYGGMRRRQIGTVYAVDGVDFDIQRGEVFSLVGESGCGKTTLGRALLQLTPPTAGRVVFDGYELTDVDPDDMRPLRRRMQIIFQDPFGSLNPRMPVSDIIGEGLLAQGVTNRQERDKMVEDSLEVVGLRRDYTRRYPHEFSGGQRQRIGVARALALGPDFIVCDEPVSALDVSIQSQILNLLLDLRRDFNLTYLFISHNLSVVQYFSDRIGVMYLGRIVEIGTVEQLYRDPRHPYTVALLSAIPDADPRRRKKRLVLKGDVPSPAAPPPGCHFSTRCWLREKLGNPERCTTEAPPLRPMSEAGHQTACHFAEDVDDQAVASVIATQSVVDTAVADPV